MFKRFTKIEQAVILAGGYIALQMIADIAATKVIVVGSMVMDAGLIYSLTFTWRDLIHKRLGARPARIAIVSAGIINLIMAGYFQLVVHLPAESEWAAAGGQSAWEFIFGLVPRVVMASIIAEVISELVDTQVYELWVRSRAHWPQWTRVAASNLISIPLDSAVFAAVAFGGVLTAKVLFNMFLSNIAVKAVFTAASFWMIYLVRSNDSAEAECAGEGGE